MRSPFKFCIIKTYSLRQHKSHLRVHKCCFPHHWFCKRKCDNSRCPYYVERHSIVKFQKSSEARDRSVYSLYRVPLLCPKKTIWECTLHSVLIGYVIIFEMPVTPSLLIKSSIYTCRIDMRQIIKHIQPKKIRSNRSAVKLHETNFKLLES